MSRLATFLLTISLAQVAGGCATWRAEGLAVPEARRLYIPVFVDNTDNGKLGVRIANAVREEVYRRQPSSLSVTFDDDTVALDGTVSSSGEEELSDGRVRLRVVVEAKLIDKTGRLVAELGAIVGAELYSPHGDVTRRKSVRERALTSVVSQISRTLVRRIHRAGRRVAGRDDGDGVDTSNKEPRS